MSDVAAINQSGRVNSGLRILQVRDHGRDIPFPCLVQYPTLASSTGTTIGPYLFDVALDADVAPGCFPICLISHGGGGSNLLYRSIGTHLAQSGYIVIAPEHHGDNRNDRTLSDTDEAALLRPRHLVLALDHILNEPAFRTAADPVRVGVLGHSLGGYAALALVGAHPWSRRGVPLPVSSDARVSAAVLLAPAVDWYLAPGALDDVRGSILVINGDQDSVTPDEHVRQTLDRLPGELTRTMLTVAGAGHFSFLSPFPESMRRSDFAPSQDPIGFDRERFHRELPDMILNFLNRAVSRLGA